MPSRKMVKENKYNLIIHYDDSIESDVLYDILRDVLAYDVTQLENIINIMRIKGFYAVKSYTTRKEALQECYLLYNYGVDCEIEKVANN